MVSKATVLTMYLLPEVNLKLRPKILDEMKPGSRVVSHAFTMGDWQADAFQQHRPAIRDDHGPVLLHPDDAGTGNLCRPGATGHRRKRRSCCKDA